MRTKMLRAPEHCNKSYKVLDISELDSTHMVHADTGNSLCFGGLPTAVVNLNELRIEDTAILSWRWDVVECTNSSRNAYIACQEAQRQGVRYLLIDKVSVDQRMLDNDMRIDRLEFSSLYQEFPVIAAYDDESSKFAQFTTEVHGAQVSLGIPFSRIMRRPWIFHETNIYRENPTKVTYVGHIPDLGCHKENGFREMTRAMWNGTMTQTILYTLAGTVGMHHVEDFCFILPNYSNVLAAAYARMSVNDFLLTAALLVGHSDGSDGRVNNDQSIDAIPFINYRFGDCYTPDNLPKTQDYYTCRDVFLGGHRVAKWQTRHKFYPFEDLRVWLKIDGGARQYIHEFLGFLKNPYDVSEGLSAKPDYKSKNPEILIVFHDKDLLGCSGIPGQS